MPAPAVPAGRVEIGLMPTFGNTVGAFILDSPIYGCLDGASISSAVTWTDISRDVIAINIAKGYDRELDVPRAGSATLTLRNEHRRFDPSNRRSPIWPGALAGTPIRIYGSLGDGSYQQLFYGEIQDSTSTPDGPFAQTCEITCFDPLADLAGLKLSHVDYPAELTSTRINNLLDSTQVSWDYGRWIDTGLSTMIASSTASSDTTISDDCLTYMQRICIAEGLGLISITKDGRFRFKRRLLNPTAINYFTLNSGSYGTLDGPYLLAPLDVSLETATSVAFSSATTKSQLADVYNSIKVNRATSASSWARDENQTSIAFLGRKRTLDVDKVLLNTDADAQLLQTRLLNRYGSVGFRYDNLIVNPTQGSGDSDKMMRLDVGDLVSLAVNQPTYRGQPWEDDDPTERYVRLEATSTSKIVNSASQYGAGATSLDVMVTVAPDTFKAGYRRLVGYEGSWEFGFYNGLLYLMTSGTSTFGVTSTSVEVPNIYGGETVLVRAQWSTTAGVTLSYSPFAGIWVPIETTGSTTTNATLAATAGKYVTVGGNATGWQVYGCAGRYYSVNLGNGTGPGFNMTSVPAGSTTWSSNVGVTTWTSTAASVDQYPPSPTITQYAYLIGLRHSLTLEAQRWSTELRLAQVGGTYTESSGGTGGGGFFFPESS